MALPFVVLGKVHQLSYLVTTLDEVPKLGSLIWELSWGKWINSHKIAISME